MEDSHGFIEMFIFDDSDEADAWKNNRGRQAISVRSLQRDAGILCVLLRILSIIYIGESARLNQPTGTGIYALAGLSNITAAGIETVNVLPTPGVESTAIFD